MSFGKYGTICFSALDLPPGYLSKDFNYPRFHYLKLGQFLAERGSNTNLLPFLTNTVLGIRLAAGIMVTRALFIPRSLRP